MKSEIRSLILQKNYPCVAAIQSVVRDDYMVESYGKLGEGLQWQKMRLDLLRFLDEQKKSQSRYLSFWAVFNEQERADDEKRFEEKMWQELSLLTSHEERAADWGPINSSDPNDPSFCLSLNGEKLFVVGLHPQSSRQSRRFSRPALVFNAFSQFEKWEQEGTYAALVQANRERDLKMQKSVNPMVLKHGDHWESIQFSGRENPSSWKCPFHFLHKKDKPS